MMQMRKKLILLIALAALAVHAEEIDLAGAWQVTGTDEAGAPIAVTANVPEDVHAALFRAGKLIDPYWGRNELKTQWVGQESWTYRRDFELSEEARSRQAICLRMTDVDTFATVYLNDVKVGETADRFLRYDFDVKPLVRAGRNELRVEFASADNLSHALTNSYSRFYPGVGHGMVHQNNYLRKPLCHGGWDWGLSQMVTGLCGDVKILAYDDFRVDYVYTEQRFADDYSRCDLTVFTEIVNADGSRETVTNAVAVEKPQLWWPAGAGPQTLTEIAWTVKGRPMRKRLGLRKLEAVSEKGVGPDGKETVSLKFRVNGRELFVKGVNWIPCDAFDARQTPAKYRYLLESAVKVNMNMVRLWGGGQYEKDCFYDLCDELGLMVWHDFMFACATFPMEEPYRSLADADTRHQLKRLRDHASIALWCGDNECVGLLWWDDSPIKGDPFFFKSHRDRSALLRQAVADCDPTRRFWTTSPYAGEDYSFANYENPAMGDVHSWEVWWAGKSFEFYYTLKPRFCSEFGYQSFSSKEIALTYVEPKDLNPTAPNFEWHQKNSFGNRLILETIARYFRFPNSVEAILYLSQVQQAIAIKTAIEWWRSLRPWCMGAMYWQLNDNWPVASWSSIEYRETTGKWKQLHYQARRFYSPLCFVGLPDNRLCAMNDTAEAVDAELTVERWTFDGQMVATKSWHDRIDADSVRHYDYAKDTEERETFLVLRMKTAEGEFVNDWKERKFKECELAETKVETSFDGLTVTLRAEKPAFFVWANVEGIPGEFDDNSVLVLPGRPVKLTFTPDDRKVTPAEFAKKFSVKHLRETY